MENEIYDHYIENTFGSAEPCPVKRAQFIYNYSRFFPKDKKAECLDIGPGRGEMLDVLKSFGYQNSRAIDLSLEVTNFCRSRGFICEHVTDTLQYLHKHPSEFEFITLCDVLEHIEKNDVLPLLKGIFHSLKSGGKLLIQVPNMAAEEAALYFYNDFTHVTGFTELSIRQVLLASNFTDINSHPMEMFCYGGIKEFIAKIIRIFFHALTRFRRMMIGAHSPEIITPVFFTLAKKP